MSVRGITSKTKLAFLNIGLGERLTNVESFAHIQHKGQVLTLDISSTGGHTAQPSILVDHDYMPDGIDYCQSNGRLYWTNMGEGSKNDGAVYSMELDGSDVQTIVKPGDAHTCKQCTVDQINHKLYFCDREGLRIFRVNLDGSNRELLIQTGDWRNDPDSFTQDPCNWPVGIAISHRLGKFFWTQKGPSKGNKGRIFAANLEAPSGSTPASRPDIELIQSDLPEPIDLEFDDEEGALYWTDRGDPPLGNTLNKKSIIGGPRECEKPIGRQILAQGFGEAIGFKLDKENRCIWAADFGGHIWKCDPDRPALKQKVYEGETSAFTGLTLIKD
ncbi:YWTD domain-containing protein [Myriangium duriaei CBS 260.36]|uniref:YWTD domain-containing protein n=1 Tax=Myriangium duriaei CBS 260.36 TaxID=1168546 RepID=A0A9P4MNI2_9PEZI|nr:YWTD domain-containing protein [Myriangium duriaei CBS 260.36]